MLFVVLLSLFAPASPFTFGWGIRPTRLSACAHACPLCIDDHHHHHHYHYHRGDTKNFTKSKQARIRSRCISSPHPFPVCIPVFSPFCHALWERPKALCVSVSRSTTMHLASWSFLNISFPLRVCLSLSVVLEDGVTPQCVASSGPSTPRFCGEAEQSLSLLPLPAPLHFW